MKDDVMKPNIKTDLMPLIELWRQRQSWLQAEIRLTLQCKAICRRYVGGDKDAANALFTRIEKDNVNAAEKSAVIATMPLLQARDLINGHRIALEKQITKLASKLPIWSGRSSALNITSMTAPSKARMT